MTTKLQDLDWLGPGGERDDIVELALPASSMVMWRLALDGGAVTWTPGLGDLLGLPDAPEGDVADRLRDLLLPITASTHSPAAFRDFELQQPLETSGGVRHVQFRARRMDRDGQPELVGIAIDVTEWHESHEALADLADRYRLLLDLSPDSIGVHQDGVVVYANPATRRILGVPPGVDLVGRPITDLVHPGSIPQMQRRLSALTGPGATTEPAEATMLRFDGTQVVVQSVSVRTTWQGRPAVQVILRDISAQKTAEAALRYQAALASHVSDAIVAVAGDGTVTSWNPAAEAVYGLPADEAVGRPIGELVGAALDPARVVHDGGVLQTTHRRQDGSSLYVRVSAAEMADGFVLVCADETARRRAERHFTTVVESLAEGVVVFNAAGLVESMNPAAERILNIAKADAVGLAATSVAVYDEAEVPIPPSRMPITLTRWTGQDFHNQVLCVHRLDGERTWLSLSCHPLHGAEDRRPYAVVASFTDITERRAISERLAFEATHDPLTGLPNRALVRDWLTTMRDQDTTTAALFVDIDKFKVINDSLGHGVGDEVLQVVGKRLRNAVRGTDLVARLGGDEFLVGAAVKDGSDAGAIAENLLAALSHPLNVHGRQLHVAASIGIVVAPPGDTRTAEELLRDADLAMYQAKTSSRDRYAFFDVELRQRTQRRLRLDEDLRVATWGDDLWVAYQPVVELPAGHLTGAEALLRWNHPAMGPISPAEFIPLAEESGAICEIGTRVLREACRTTAARRAAGLPGLHVAVNLSAVQLEDPNLAGLVHEILSDSGLPASALSLEITESMIMRDHVAATRQLNELRGLGVRLAIDDFGTGYSSLAQLRRLPLDTLKIDRSFVSGLGESPDAVAIVRSIIAMAHAVDLTVIAEGVETEQQLEVLQTLSCDQAQGYYFGRPGPADEVFAGSLGA